MWDNVTWHASVSTLVSMSQVFEVFNLGHGMMLLNTQHAFVTAVSRFPEFVRCSLTKYDKYVSILVLGLGSRLRIEIVSGASIQVWTFIKTVISSSRHIKVYFENSFSISSSIFLVEKMPPPNGFP